MHYSTDQVQHEINAFERIGKVEICEEHLLPYEKYNNISIMIVSITVPVVLVHL